mmetsp:Transcript_18733/g.25337  ORF Transcript_18733/g.25337 Transcript_18733/m.25337 type:complete len:210 (-) Transcript_18733:585-1214(-)
MAALRISTLASDRAANFLAMMLLALFELVADSLALQAVDVVDLFACHHLCPHIVWVVDLVAGELGLGLVTDAAFVDRLLAPHALVIVTLLDALVASTRQEPLAERVTYRYRLDTALALPTKETLDRLVARRTVNLSRWVSLAGLALAWVTDFFALMMSAVQDTVALLFARFLSLPTEHVIHSLATEARLLDGHLAGLAWTGVTDLLTLV